MVILVLVIVILSWCRHGDMVVGIVTEGVGMVTWWSALWLRVSV